MTQYLTKSNVLFTLQLIVALLTIIWLLKSLKQLKTTQKSIRPSEASGKSYITEG